MLEQKFTPQDPQPLAAQNLPPASQELKAIGEELERRLPIQDIDLIPCLQMNALSDIRALYPQGKVYVCDFNISDIQTGVEHPAGYELDGVMNVDHHSETARMARQISSGNLAAAYVLEHGPVPCGIPVVINHTDCDSIVSSFTMRGHLPPHPAFGQAVIAADHTGEPNAVADLLQALDRKRDMNFSARNLAYLLQGKPLENEAQDLLDRRLQEREIAKAIRESGAYELVGKVLLIQGQSKVSGEFLPALFPEAALIVAASLMNGDRWEVKLRLGAADSPLKALDFDRIRAEVDPNAGGRWNAGSNRRGGGTMTEPRKYAESIAALFGLQ